MRARARHRCSRLMAPQPTRPSKDTSPIDAFKNSKSVVSEVVPSGTLSNAARFRMPSASHSEALLEATYGCACSR
jgi:hypothetical protein